MVETTTHEGTPQGGAGVPAGKPEGMPEVPASEGEVASLLDKLNKPGGEQAQAPPVEPKPEGAPEQPASVQIPDKFKNPDGSVNTEAWAKSHSDLEKKLSELFQERSEYRKAQDQMGEMQEYIKRIDEWREQTLAEKNPEKVEGDYTPEEIEDMRVNPKKYIKSEVQKELKSFQKEQASENKLKGEINAAVNYGRANVDGFSRLEPKIAERMKSDAFSQHPESVQQAYYAELGEMMPEMLRQSKDMGFTEGYKKHGEEMKLHVEGGGKASMPAEGGTVTAEQIKGMTAEQLEKMLPHVERSVQRDNKV